MTVASKQATAGHSNQLNDYIAADAEAKITEAYQSNSARIDAMEDPQLRAIMQRSMASMAANVRSIANTDTESVVRCNEPSRGLLGKKCTAEVVKVHKSKGRY
jgi:hypothetical protein